MDLVINEIQYIFWWFNLKVHREEFAIVIKLASQVYSIYLLVSDVGNRWI